MTSHRLEASHHTQAVEPGKSDAQNSGREKTRQYWLDSPLRQLISTQYPLQEKALFGQLTHKSAKTVFF